MNLQEATISPHIFIGYKTGLENGRANSISKVGRFEREIRMVWRGPLYDDES